jgi:predicted double-glycine peptidase
MNKQQKRKAEILFSQIKDLAKDMNYTCRVNQLKCIVQNPDFSRKEDFKIWSKDCSVVVKEMNEDYKSSIDELREIYKDIKELFDELE